MLSFRMAFLPHYATTGKVYCPWVRGQSVPPRPPSPVGELSNYLQKLTNWPTLQAIPCPEGFKMKGRREERLTADCQSRAEPQTAASV